MSHSGNHLSMFILLSHLIQWQSVGARVKGGAVHCAFKQIIPLIWLLFSQQRYQIPPNMLVLSQNIITPATSCLTNFRKFRTHHYYSTIQHNFLNLKTLNKQKKYIAKTLVQNLFPFYFGIYTPRADRFYKVWTTTRKNVVNHNSFLNFLS